MDTNQWIVLVSGAALSVFVLWYFFGKRQAAVAAKTETGVQEVEITVQGGYSPNVIAVERNRPVRLRFHRKEDESCSEQVIISDFGIVKDLPAFRETIVEFTPDRAGEFTFTCGMNMLHGKLVVR